MVWTSSSVQSNWVLDGAMHGRERGCLVPARFDDTPPPLGYRQIQTIDLALESDYPDGQAAASIGRAVTRIAGRAQAAPVPSPGTGIVRPGKRTGRKPL